MAMTFGFQAQRMDANERERTYGSLATFGFSNVADGGLHRRRHAQRGHRATRTRASCWAT